MKSVYNWINLLFKDIWWGVPLRMGWWLVKSSGIIYCRGLYDDVPMGKLQIYTIHWVTDFRRVAN